MIDNAEDEHEHAQGDKRYSKVSCGRAGNRGALPEFCKDRKN
jgi:hypothetical protein